MNLDDLTLGQIKELKRMGKKEKIINDGSVRICVLQRGWIVVGKFSQKGSECKVTNASIIRTWGTTKGLGEIAENGPTEKTILDKTPDVIFHELVGVFQIICRGEKWEPKLK